MPPTPMLKTTSHRSRQDGQNPKLPLELEREIFKLTVRVYPKTAPMLLRVAHRVQTWIEPLLWETLILLDIPGSPSLVNSSLVNSSLIYAFQSKPGSFFHHNVRNLLLDDYCCTQAEHSLILSACSGVRDLASFNSRRSLLYYLDVMTRLKRLTIYLDQFFDFASMDSTLLPSFSTITHLDTWLTPSAFLATQFAWPPALTHLCLFEARPSGLNHALMNCKNLKILINRYIGAETVVLARKCQDLSITDPRLILALVTSYNVRVKDWEVGTQGGRDLWARADLFVTKKNRGEIQPGLLC
ncbi:hypothetical protein C8R44DRAFT_748282 [Mycena epipterygia]|nr:hypothetical protein C8R44DRAFT_748282 [Mycena epipterygia]